MNTSLTELADRVEKLTGPDRELDALITIEHHGFPHRAYQQRNGMRPACLRALAAQVTK